MTINNKYSIGQIVFLKTDREQLPRLVYSILVYSDQDLLYKTVSGTVYHDALEIELSGEKDEKLTLGIS